jgi:hypothetical protein
MWTASPLCKGADGVGAWEGRIGKRGRRATPETIAKLAQALGVPVAFVDYIARLDIARSFDVEDRPDPAGYGADGSDVCVARPML